MRLIDADELTLDTDAYCTEASGCYKSIADAPTIDAVSVVRCKNCKKSHIDGKTTHYLWCTEWGRSTDTFGYCERGEREGK